MGAVSASPLPVSPTPAGVILHRYTAMAEISSAGFRRETPRRSCLHAGALYPGQSPLTARPLLRGREEAAVVAGRWGSMNAVQPEMQEIGEVGAVSASPLPVSPTPAGAILHRYTAAAEISSAGFKRETPRRSCLHPGALYPGQSPRTARPLLRGREEALMSGRAVGVVTGRDAHREWFESIVNGGVKFPTCYREEVERFISRNC